MEIDEKHEWFLPDHFIEKTDNDEVLLYADTDSCVGSTKISINNKHISIEDFYEQSDGRVEKKSKENFVKYLNSKYITPSLSKKLDIENNDVIYIMKHLVKKRMFKIIVDRNEVIITEDHSIMVLRNSKLIKIKPDKVQKNDRIITICEPS